MNNSYITVFDEVLSDERCQYFIDKFEKDTSIWLLSIFLYSSS